MPLITTSRNVPSKSQREDTFGYQPEVYFPKWSSSARLAVFTVGVSALILAVRSRSSFRSAFALFGIASMIRAFTNLPVTDIVGRLANPVVRLKRTLFIHAPVETVYDFLSHFSNYPKFMSYVKNVEVNEVGGLRWTIEAPLRTTIHWNTSLGKMIRNQAISWKSSVNSWIRNAGDIQLLDRRPDGTEVHIQLSYAPPVGALGYAVAHFLGFDPKDKVDSDLQTLKKLIENGKQTRMPQTETRKVG